MPSRGGGVKHTTLTPIAVLLLIHKFVGEQNARISNLSHDSGIYGTNSGFFQKAGSVNLHGEQGQKGQRPRRDGQRECGKKLSKIMISLIFEDIWWTFLQSFFCSAVHVLTLEMNWNFKKEIKFAKTDQNLIGVGLTLIWVFHYLAQRPNHFSPISQKAGRIGQTVEHTKVNPTIPWAVGTPRTFHAVKFHNQKSCIHPRLIFRVADAVPLAPLAVPALPNVSDAAPDVAEFVVQVQRRREEIVPNGDLSENVPVS